MTRVRNLSRMVFLALAMMFAVLTSLKFSQTFTQQPLTQKFLMIIVLLISPQTYVLFHQIHLRANEFGGITHTSEVISTKLLSSKTFGSTVAE